jgi:hypothetical protein
MARRPLPEHEISAWGPMSQVYYNPNLNNYVHGPGSELDRSLLPCHPRYVCMDLVLPEDCFD